MSCRVLCDVVCDMICSVVLHELLSLLWYSDTIVLCNEMQCRLCGLSLYAVSGVT